MPAHHIRNRSSQTFRSACAIPSRYRWCLTGTPIHNSLDDYAALLTFIRVPHLGDQNAFNFWIASPIKSNNPNGVKRLQSLVKATCLRRTKATIGSSFELPRRIEDIEYIDLHLADQDLYNFFKTKTADMAANFTGRTGPDTRPDGLRENNILVLINFLRLICAHGKELLPDSAVEAWKRRDRKAIDWRMMSESRKRCGICGRDTEETDNPSSNSPQFNCQHFICATCAIQEEETTAEDEGRKCLICVMKPRNHDVRRGKTSTKKHTSPSAKVEALLRNLQRARNTRNPSRLEHPIKRSVGIDSLLSLGRVTNSLLASFSLTGLEC